MSARKELHVIVMKFGGSSVADAERIHAVAEIVRRRMERRPLVVVSALAGVTDLLERAFDLARRDDLEGLEPTLADIERRHRWAIAGCVESAGPRHRLELEVGRGFEELRQQLRSVRVLGEGTPRVRDAVLACGERLSTEIVAAAFRQRELPARRIDAGKVMATDDRFGAAVPDAERVRAGCLAHLLPLLEAGELPVVGGFYGASPAGETTTLGRGGSDTSAAMLGLALDAEEIQIWTDVDGLMSADPRLVQQARTLETVSFTEAAELALYGARVLHPDAIAPALDRHILVRVLNSMRPEGAGTRIVADGARPEDDGPVALATKGGVGLVRISSRRLPMEPTLPRAVLACCAEAGITPELFLSSATTVTVVSSDADRLEALKALEGAAEIEITRDLAMLCVVGSAMAAAHSLREKVLSELARWQAETVAAGALRASIVGVVRQAVLGRAVESLHQRFFEREAAT